MKINFSFGRIYTDLENIFFKIETFRKYCIIAIFISLIVGIFVFINYPFHPYSIFQFIFCFVFGLLLFLSRIKKVNGSKFFHLLLSNFHYITPFYFVFLSYFLELNGLNNIANYTKLIYAFSILFLGFISKKSKDYLINSLLNILLAGILLSSLQNCDYDKIMAFVRTFSFVIVGYFILILRKSLKEKLYFNEKLYKHLFNDLKDPFFIINSNTGKILSCNNKAYEILEVENDSEIIGKSIKDFIKSVEADRSINFLNNIDDEIVVEGETFKKQYFIAQIKINQVDKDFPSIKIFHLKDLTKNKIAEKLIENLTISESLDKKLTCIINKDFEIEFANDLFIELLGYPENQLINSNYFDYVIHTNNSAEDIKNTLKNKFWEGQIERLRSNGQILYLNTLIKGVKDDEGNITHYIEISEDITIFKKAEEALKVSQEFNQGLIRTIPDFMFILDENGVFIDFNTSNSLDLFSRPEDFIGKSVEEILPPHIAKLTLDVIQQVKETKEMIIYDYSLEVNKQKKYYEARMILLNNNQYMAIIRDITEKSVQKAELELTQKRYYVLFEKAESAIIIIKNYKFIECNTKALELFGYNKEEFLNHAPDEFSPEYQDDGSLSSEKARLLIDLTLNNEPQVFEWKHKKRDGIVFDALVSLYPFEVDENQYIQVYLRDITEQKKAEYELIESREKYYMLFSKASDAIFIFREGKFIDCNEKALELFSVEKEYFVNEEFFNLTSINQDISSDKQILLHKLLFKGVPLAFEWRFVNKDKNIIDVELRSNKFTVNNEKYVQVFIKDITEQKRITLALTESERHLSALMNNFPGIAYRSSFDDNYTMEFISKGCIDLTGYTPDQFINNKELSFGSIVISDPINEENRQDIINSAQLKQPFKINYRIRTKDGKSKWVCEQGETILDNFGNIIGLEGFITDVTKQKEYEYEIIESQQKYYKLFSEAFDGILIMKNDIFIDCNEKATELFKRKRYDLIGSKYNCILFEEGEFSMIHFKEKLDELKYGKAQMFLWQYVRSDSSAFDAEVSMSSFYINDMMYTQLIIRDITKRLLTQRFLKQSEKNLTKLIETSPTGIIITDLNQIFFTNISVLKILGYETDNQLRNKKFYDLFQDSELDNIKQHLSELTGNLDMPFIEVKMLKSDNEQVEIELKGALFIYNEKEAYQIVLRDVSVQKNLLIQTLKNQMMEESNAKLMLEVEERMKAEELIKKSLTEKEVLLKEVHHRVKNNMQIISSIINLQASYIIDNHVKEMFQESQDRIKSMALIHESLYRNEDLSQVNFRNYITTLVDNLYRSYNIDFSNIKLNLQVEDIFFNLDVGIPCGLIINELISNSLKYAFKGLSQGVISVAISVKSNNEFELIIADNGIGIDDKIDIFNTNSLGLQLVNTLVNQLEGEIKIEKGKGTKFIITFKI